MISSSPDLVDTGGECAGAGCVARRSEGLAEAVVAASAQPTRPRRVAAQGQTGSDRVRRGNSSSGLPRRWLPLVAARSAPARGTAQRVHLEDLPQELGPAPARLAQRERHGLGDGRRPVRHGPAPSSRAAHAMGVVAVVARHHLAFVRNVRREPREELQRNSSGSTVSVPAVGPSGFSER